MNRRAPIRHHKDKLTKRREPGLRNGRFTGATAAGILIERVTGAPFAEALSR
jgi:CubicO group peptidase (beta-lactamase class C family)